MGNNCGLRDVDRRQFLTVTGVVSATALAGCSGILQEGEVIADEKRVTRFDDKRYPIEASKDDTIVMDASVEEGGPMVVIVSRRESEGYLLKERVDTENKFEVTVKRDGLHDAIAIIASGRGIITVRHIPSD